MKLPLIEIGFQVYAADGQDPFGAVRQVAPGGQPTIMVNVEGAGDFVLPLTAVASVHAGKVVVKVDELAAEVRHAIGHAHDLETD